MNDDTRRGKHPPRSSPTAQQEASAHVIRRIRAAQIIGRPITLDPASAGELADHIENLAGLVDRHREAAYLLMDRLAELGYPDTKPSE